MASSCGFGMFFLAHVRPVQCKHLDNLSIHTISSILEKPKDKIIEEASKKVIYKINYITKQKIGNQTRVTSSIR